MSSDAPEKTTIDSAGDDAALADVPANYRRGARRTWHQRRRHRAIQRMMKGLRGSLLDYGCGYGDIAHLLSETCDVVAVDVDPVRVAFAAREYPEIRFAQCPASGVDLPDASVDIVVSAVVIHFVPDPHAYLGEIQRVLRPGGRLVIACKNPPIVLNALRRLFGRRVPEGRLWVRSQADIESMLQEYGFTIERRTYFYDPPFEGWKNIGDAVSGTIEQCLSIVQFRRTAQYFVLRLKKAA